MGPTKKFCSGVLQVRPDKWGRHLLKINLELLICNHHTTTITKLIFLCKTYTVVNCPWLFDLYIGTYQLHVLFLTNKRQFFSVIFYTPNVITVNYIYIRSEVFTSVSYIHWSESNHHLQWVPIHVNLKNVFVTWKKHLPLENNRFHKNYQYSILIIIIIIIMCNK